MLNLVVISQEKKILETQCVSVTVPTQSGVITVLPQHAPLCSLLHYGEVVIKIPDQNPSFLLVSGGFVSVLKNKVTLLTDFGVRSEELDEKVIAQAKQRAEETIRDKSSEEMLEKARADLLHASLQLEYLKQRKHSHTPRPEFSSD